MRRVIWIFLLIVISAATSAKTVTPIEEPLPAIDPNVTVDPNIIKQEILEVESMVRELPVKEQTLKEKEYIGTIDTVLEQRISDVNDVLVFAKTMTEKAKAVCDKLDLKPAKKDYVKTVIDHHGKVNEKEDQKRNNEIIKIIAEYASDPNSLPDSADPNYIEELNRRKDLLAVIIEICDPK